MESVILWVIVGCLSAAVLRIWWQEAAAQVDAEEKLCELERRIKALERQAG